MDEVVTALTAITVIAALMTVWIAREALRETRRMREAATEPEIAVYLDVDPQSRIMSAVLRNIGQGSAYNVSVTFEDVVPELAGYRLSDVGFFKGIRFVAPGQTLSSVVGSTISVLGDKGFTAANVTAQFENRVGRAYSIPYALRPDIFRNVMRTSNDAPEKAVVKAIDANTRVVRDELQTLSQTIAQVGVILGDDTAAPDAHRTVCFSGVDERLGFQVLDGDLPDEDDSEVATSEDIERFPRNDASDSETHIESSERTDKQ